jgi:hypothetical protein
MKYNIFELMWKFVSNLFQTGQVSTAHSYFYWIGFDSLFHKVNNCPSSIELHLMILMFERGCSTEIIKVIISRNGIPNHGWLFKIVSRLIQYQRGKCHCNSNKCIYNAEQPLISLPEREKDKYRQLYEYDLIDEENRLLYSSFTLYNGDNNPIHPTLADLLNFTPTFARLTELVVNFIDNHDIVKHLLKQNEVISSSSGYSYLFEDKLFNNLSISEKKMQLRYHLEHIYYRYHGYSINSQSKLEQIKEFITSSKNKSGITIENSIVLAVYPYINP